MAKLTCELQLLRSRHTMLGNLRQKDSRDLACRHLLFLGQSTICKNNREGKSRIMPKENEAATLLCFSVSSMTGMAASCDSKISSEVLLQELNFL